MRTKPEATPPSPCSDNFSSKCPHVPTGRAWPMAAEALAPGRATVKLADMLKGGIKRNLKHKFTFEAYGKLMRST